MEAGSRTAFIGRQAIFDNNLQVYAYELLFRSGDVDQSAVQDGDRATSEVMVNAFMDIGLDAVANGCAVFFNLTRSFLTGGIAIPFTPDRAVLEVLEDIEPDAEVVEAVRRLSERGFSIALDDVVYRPQLRPLVKLADIIKIDLLAVPPGSLNEQVRRLRADNPTVQLLAEKVETSEQFSECRSLGFAYYQGYFFAKPQIISGQRMPANRVAILNLLSRLQDPKVTMDDLERLIAQDVSLAYRLLRYINSAAFAMHRKVDSVRHALVMVGTRAVRNWVSLIVLSRLDDKPRELVVMAMVRARMCELLAAEAGLSDKDTSFTVGLFSVLDGLMDRSMAELLDALPLADEVKSAVLERTGPAGDLLARVEAYEAGHWDRLSGGAIPPRAYRPAWLEAIRWVHEVTKAS